MQITSYVWLVNIGKHFSVFFTSLKNVFVQLSPNANTKMISLSSQMKSASLNYCILNNTRMYILFLNNLDSQSSQM